jgi:hypothetical protein
MRRPLFLSDWSRKLGCESDSVLHLLGWIYRAVLGDSGGIPVGEYATRRTRSQPACGDAPYAR